MIEPFAKDEAFLASVEEPLGAKEVRVWWLGQSGFLVRWREKRVLFDPYLSDSLTRKYQGTDKPHVRMTERVIAPERLRGIDWMFSTHNHTDHLDAETLVPLRRTNPEAKLVFPVANRAFITQRLGAAIEPYFGMTDGTRIGRPGAIVGESFIFDSRSGSFEINAVPAAHNEVERDERGFCRFLGYVVRIGPWQIYHSGDTLLYPGMEERLRAFGHIDLALLPINGNKPERHVAGNLDGREAAQLAHDIGATLVVPCHYEMFEFNTADPRELFVPECERLGQAYRVLRAGEALTLGR